MPQIEYRFISYFKKLHKFFGLNTAIKIVFLPRLLGRMGIGGLFFKNILAFQRRLVSDIIDKYKVFEYVPSNTLGKNSKIWIFWWQGYENMPEVIHECYKSVIRNYPEYDITLIDRNNFTQFLHMPDYIMEKFYDGAISPSHFSDIVRLKLLSEYGGWWLDAALYVVSPYTLTGDLFMPSLGGNADSLCQGRWWFGCFASAPHHKLVDFLLECLLRYWQVYDTYITYLMFDGFVRLAYESFNDVAKEIDDFPQCCPDLHTARQNFDKPIDEKKFIQIINNNNFLSLTWRKPYPKSVNGNMTYYGALLSEKRQTN